MSFDVTLGHLGHFSADPKDSDTEAVCWQGSEYTYLGGVNDEGWFHLSFNGCANPGTYSLVAESSDQPGVTDCSWSPRSGSHYVAKDSIPNAYCTVTIQRYDKYVEGYLSANLVDWDFYYNNSRGEISAYGTFKLKVSYR